MKRLFILIICLLSLQFSHAGSVLNPGEKHISQSSSKDTSFAHAAANQAQLNADQSIIKSRLDAIKKDVPLDYNEFVQNYIDIYSQNREEMGHVIGLSKYYFPIYEKIFRDAGIPAEIEYLSIVESKLDPNAISRVGATGPWQFMGTTAKLYGLNMDGYIDERRDPVRASYAAAAYLKDAYEEFGDWLLAIASYNCGKSNVENALAKAGGATDFWSIRQYLPAETRNYVPAYIAVAYVMNYYKKHNITEQPCSFALNIDTVVVDRQISLNTVSNILGVDAKLLSLLNPAYRMQVINASAHSPRRLIIPQVERTKYSALYDALNNTTGSTSYAAAASPKIYVPLHSTYSAADDKPAYHKVKRGETLADIADRYGVEVSDLKTWNHLHHNKAVVGQRLKISNG
ncbi:lytic transglycosylase domain-containing protein [Mucilaginibacter sp.]